MLTVLTDLQRRAKAEEARVTAEIEEAFRTLTGVANLRRQDAVGARRDRARESNARADEGHGRASKRRRMQAETKAAELAARAREAHTAAAATKKEARARARSSSRGRSIDRRANTRGRVTTLRARSHDTTRLSASPRWQPSAQQSKKLPRGDRSRREPRRNEDQSPAQTSPHGTVEGGRGRGRARGTGDRDTHGKWETGRGAAAAVRGSQRAESARPLAEVLGEAKAVVDEGETGGRGSGSSRQEPGNVRRPSSGRRRGWRDEFWVPSGADDENMAMERRLQHLDELAARLEETEAGLGAKLDKISGGSHRLQQSSVACNNGPTSDGGRDRGTVRGGRFASVCGGSDVHDSASKFRHRGGASPGRRRRTSNVSRDVGRLAAPTISSNLKAKPGPADVNAAGRGGVGGVGGGVHNCNSSARRRRRGGDSVFVRKGKAHNDNERRSGSGKYGQDRFAACGVAGGGGGGGDGADRSSGQRKGCLTRVKQGTIAGARVPAAVVVASTAAPDKRSKWSEAKAKPSSAGRHRAVSGGGGSGGDGESKHVDDHRQDLEVEEKDSRNGEDGDVLGGRAGRGTDRGEHGRGRGGGERRDSRNDRRSDRYDKRYCAVRAMSLFFLVSVLTVRR